MIKKVLIITFCAAFAMSCGNETAKQGREAVEEALNTTDVHTTIEVSKTFNDVLESLPSPIESAYLLKKSGGVFDASLINTQDNLGKYTTQTAMALNLGVYGTDLGYANIYTQNQQALDMMNAVKQLANGLNIGEYFDIVTLKRLMSNSKNLDSLLLISTSNLQRINRDLIEKNRSHISLLILTGGWVEGMYLLSKTYSASKNEALAMKIAEQKIIINLLSPLFDQLKTRPEFENISAGINRIAEAYAAVQTNAPAEKTVVVEEVNGVPTATGVSSSTSTYTDADILKVAAAIESFRNEIVQ
jgi:hypothetical protein